MNIMKRFLCVLMAMLSLQMAALSADRGQMPEDEPQSGFADISPAHEEHWGPNEDRGMLLTAGQWADMLCRSVEPAMSLSAPVGRSSAEKAFRNEWLSLESVVRPDTNVCREVLYQSAFRAFRVDVYSSELYPHSMPLSPWENIMRVAGELGIVCYGKDGAELVTRDEAEDLLKQLAATDIELVAPPIASQISIENKDGALLNPYLLELRKIPEPILEQFQQLGWKITLDRDYLMQLGQDRDMSYIGVTVYLGKSIYISDPSALIHEMGHFVHGMLSFPESFERLFMLENKSAVEILGEYASTSSREYFAEYFAFWVQCQNSTQKMEYLAQASPETYRYFEEMEGNHWLLVETE